MRFGLLGPVTIADGGISASIGRSQRRGLLAYLLLNPGRWISADAITEALWGGAEPASARQQIQTSVHAIRSELRRLGAPDALEGSGSGYRVDLAQHGSDLNEFVELVAAARESTRAGQFAESEQRLVCALDLWRGAALADASGAFVESARAGLEDQRSSATEDLLAVRLALGRHSEVLAALGPLLAAHPLRERLRGQHMLALYRDGRQVDALDAFRTFRDLLVDEHGLDPHPDLQALERAILTGDPALTARPAAAAGPTRRSPAPIAPAPSPGPSHDSAPGGAAAIGGPPRRDDQVRPPTPAQLPAAASAFVGRVAELARLDHALALGRADADRPATVLINTVDGAGGVGKTATAVTWAHRVRHEFPDGQLYVNMHGYSTMPAVAPLTALHRLLEALGVAPEQAPVEVEAAASLYRTRLAGRRMLLLIDNVNDVDQVRPLLPGHAGCLVIITSRARLTGLIAREGAHRVSLGGLSPDESLRLLARILGQDRVDAEPAAAAEIAQACDHLPLALRVVAANLSERPSIGLAEYAATLAKAGRLDDFEVEGDAEASVRVALAQSYGALDADPRRVFQVMGLVPGPDATVSMMAAMADLPIERAGAALERLASMHLVDEVAPGRFGMHDLVRFFARERGAAEATFGDRDTAVRRLFGYYTASLDAVATWLYPQFLRLAVAPVAGIAGDQPGDVAAALEWGEANRASIVAAVRWAAADGRPRLAAELADAVRGFFWIRRHMADWFDVARAATDAARGLGDQRLITAAALSMGMAHRAQADYGPSAEHLELALTASRAADWPEAEASALGSMAIVHGELCDFARAMQCLAEALDLNRRIGRRAGQAVAQGNLASYKLRAGDLPGAYADSIEALELYREVGALGGEAIVLANLAAISYGLGEYPAGLAYVADALALQERIGDQNGASLALIMRCMIRLELGDIDEAERAAAQAIEYAQASQDPPREADALITYAAVALARGDGEQARQDSLRAAQMGREANSATAQAEALIATARATQALGRADEALTCAREALEISRSKGLMLLVGEALTVIAEGLIAIGDLAEAREHVREAQVVQRACGHRPREATTLILLGRLESAAGRTPAAVRAFTEAETMLSAMGSAQAATVRALLSAVDGQASVSSGPSGAGGFSPGTA